MKLTEQQFLDSLNADQTTFFNDRLISIRNQFQASYAASVAEVSAAKDQLLTDCRGALAGAVAERDALQASLATMMEDRDAQKAIADTVPGLQEQVATLSVEKAALQAEVERLTLLVPPPLGPREITPREFLARISDQDKLTIWNSDDPRCAAAMWELFAATSINLDSPVLAGMIDMLIEAGVDIDETERARIFA
jgi:hypothetical protein